MRVRAGHLAILPMFLLAVFPIAVISGDGIHQGSPMNNRRESAVVVCIMYAFLIAACVWAALGFTTDPYIRESLLELPIFVQLVIAEAIGLTPWLQDLARATHWTLPYFSIILMSFYSVYGIGRWIGSLDEDRV
jgi:hypothetical protein